MKRQSNEPQSPELKALTYLVKQTKGVYGTLEGQPLSDYAIRFLRKLPLRTLAHHE